MDIYSTAVRVPPSRFLRLADLKECASCSVQGLISSSYAAEKTAGADLKSVLMLLDPTVPTFSAVKVNIFFPRQEDHPNLNNVRAGDVFRATNVAVKNFRGKLEITVSLKNNSTYEVLDGEHNNVAIPRSNPPSPEEAELLLLRDFRLKLIAEDSGFARRCMGPGQYTYRSYPPKSAQLYQFAQQQHQMQQQQQQQQQNHFLGAPAIPPPAPIYALPPSVLAPASRPVAPVTTFAAPSNKKTLGELTFPVNGSRGYLADLAAVRLLSIEEPVQGKRLILMLWDGTGPRPNSCMPNALAETVQATCWEPLTGKLLLACGSGSWVELSKVRVAPNKQKEGELEVHLNDSSAVRKLVDTDPLVQNLLQKYAEKESRAALKGPGTWTCKCGALNFTDNRTCNSCLNVVPMTAIVPQAGRDQWQCSACHTLTFKSRRQCYGCQKPYNKDKDIYASGQAATPKQAAHAPAPLTVAVNGAVVSASPNLVLADAAPLKRVRRELTQVVGLLESHQVRENDGNLVYNITRLANVVSSPHDNGRFVVNVKVLRVYPLETRHCTRPVCPSCSNVLPGDVTDFSNLKACATCGADLDSRSLQFKYWVALDIKDGAVTLPVLICGGDADLFFRSFPACDLWTNPVTHQLLSQKLDLLCNGGDMVTLAIQSYVPVTGDAKKKRIYQVFNTVLE